MVILSPYLPLAADFQKLFLVIPFVFTIVIVINNLERLILFIIALGVPLNLDISVIISPYARNISNAASGRTIVALTELRISLITLIIAIGYLIWLVKRPGSERVPIRYFASTSIPALVLVIISTLSLVQAQDKQLAVFKVILLVELFLIYFYVANHLRSKEDFQFFLSVFLGVILVESILMIIQWRTGLNFSIAGINANIDPTSHRAAGTLGTANSAALIITAYLILTAVMFWLFPRTSQKIFAALCMGFGSIALLSTAGRAAWGGFLVGILIFLMISWLRRLVRRRTLVSLFLSIIVIAAVFFPVIYTRLTANDRGSAASRMMMNRLAWNVIQSSASNFYFGVGANNYALVAPAYYTTDIGELGYIIDSSVHNAYFLVWAETGLIGVIFFLAFLAIPLFKTWKYIRLHDRYISLLALGLGCALIAIYIQMLADPFIARPKLIIVWLLIGLVAAIQNIVPRNKVFHRTEISLDPPNVQQDF